MRACDYSVFEIDYETEVAEYAPHPGGEMERTGRKFVERHVYRCVAPSEEFAHTAFRRYHPISSHKMLQIRDIGKINDIVTIA